MRQGYPRSFRAQTSCRPTVVRIMRMIQTRPQREPRGSAPPKNVGPTETGVPTMSTNRLTLTTCNSGPWPSIRKWSITVGMGMALTAAPLLAGCGSSDDTAPSTSPSETSSVVTTTVTTTEVTTSPAPAPGGEGSMPGGPTGGGGPEGGGGSIPGGPTGGGGPGGGGGAIPGGPTGSGGPGGGSGSIPGGPSGGGGPGGGGGCVPGVGCVHVP